MNTVINQIGPVQTDTPQRPKIKTATKADAAAIVAILTAAFRSDPVARWIYPDEREFDQNFPELVRRFGGRAFEHETAWHIDRSQAGALWLAPEVTPDEDALMTLLQSTVSEGRLPNVFAMFEQMGTYHPTEPHWYLPLVGVAPAHQGNGLGTALVRIALERCDRDRVPAYLESSNPRNISLYERLGFRKLGQIRSGSSPTMVPMLRLPEE
jgi:ribosomal protein S18 acetylase RimI-like enzyme